MRLLQTRGEFRYLFKRKPSGALYGEWLPHDNTLAEHFVKDNLSNPATNLNPNDPRTEALESGKLDRKAIYWEQLG